MTLTNDELWALVRSSEWIYNDDFPKDKSGLKLHKKMQKFYSKNCNQLKFKIK